MLLEKDPMKPLLILVVAVAMLAPGAIEASAGLCGNGVVDWTGGQPPYYEDPRTPRPLDRCRSCPSTSRKG